MARKSKLTEDVLDTILTKHSNGLPINIYDPKSAGAESYRALAKEIIERKDI